MSVCAFVYINTYSFEVVFIIAIVAITLVFVAVVIVATCVALCHNKLCNSNLHCNDPTLAVKRN